MIMLPTPIPEQHILLHIIWIIIPKKIHNLIPGGGPLTSIEYACAITIF